MIESRWSKQVKKNQHNSCSRQIHFYCYSTSLTLSFLNLMEMSYSSFSLVRIPDTASPTPSRKKCRHGGDGGDGGGLMAQSHSFNSMDCSQPGSSAIGFSRQEYWSRLPFPSPGDLPDPGIEPAASPVSFALAGGFFTAKPPRKPSRCSSVQYSSVT